jgi:1-acyl-sn-glycerol-3-phosphate acyltransferase
MRIPVHKGNSLRAPSSRILRLFSVYLKWYLRRHFHGVRISNSARLTLPDGPLIVYLNHASWWDPLTCMLLARRFFPGREHYAPMDASALARYPMFGRMGMFPVEQETHRGAVQFLRASEQILLKPNAMLWLTPQGAFTDVRQRPIVLKPGLAALIRRRPETVALPLALEYCFWNERLPEVLINVGPAQHFREAINEDTLNESLVGALAASQDALATSSAARDGNAFETLLSGRAGVGLLYDAARRLRSVARRETFHAEHHSTPEGSEHTVNDTIDSDIQLSLKEGRANPS